MENSQTTNKKPSLTDAAGWMALPIGIMWSASFLCTMYGTGHPLLSMLSTALGIISIYMLYRQLTNYRRLYPTVSWLHIFRLSMLLYFAFLDNGRLLSILGSAMQSEEYREAWKQLMPEADMKEVQQMVQSMTVRDIMLQLVTYNVLLALPISLMAALPVRKVKVGSEK